MRFVLRTQVDGYYKEVMRKFDLALFEALKPKGAKMEIVQFTGSETGDVVELKFIFPLKARWVSKIIDHGADEDKAYFIDQGEVLPFPLRNWKHKHIVEKHSDTQSIIVDDISFSSGYELIDLLIYLPLLLSFYPRKGVYKKYFAQKGK